MSGTWKLEIDCVEEFDSEAGEQRMYIDMGQALFVALGPFNGGGWESFSEEQLAGIRQNLKFQLEDNNNFYIDVKGVNK